MHVAAAGRGARASATVHARKRAAATGRARRSTMRARAGRGLRASARDTRQAGAAGAGAAAARRPDGGGAAELAASASVVRAGLARLGSRLGGAARLGLGEMEDAADALLVLLGAIDAELGHRRRRHRPRPDWRGWLPPRRRRSRSPRR